MTRTVKADITRFQGPERHEVTDRVAIEEPLEIRVDFVANGERCVRSLSITMRTPGHDEELAAGLALLFVEREGSGQLGVRAFGEDAQDEGGIEGERSHGC